MNSVHPLYYFTGSTKPGQLNGQGANAFGARWDAVRPSGAQSGQISPLPYPGVWVRCAGAW